MLTEVSPTLWAVRVNGQTVATNLISRQIAEGIVFALPPDQRQLAEVIPVASDGRQVLFG